MTRFIYVNGLYQRYEAAQVHAEDRGFQFADSVYEVIEVLDGQLVDATRHLSRLQRSLDELRIPSPMSKGALVHVIGEVLAKNRVRNGIVYMQVSRGAGPREFALPPPSLRPTLVILARNQQKSAITELSKVGISVITLPDNRWERCDIKTVMLLPAVLAKDKAREAGAREAWFVDEEGCITEGASSNAWIVTAAGDLVTRPLNNRILPGITRATVFDVAKAEKLAIVERPFTREEALASREAFVTSATNIVMPVVKIDGQPVADGKPGPLSQRLRLRFHHVAEISAAVG